MFQIVILQFNLIKEHPSNIFAFLYFMEQLEWSGHNLKGCSFSNFAKNKLGWQFSANLKQAGPLGLFN